MTVTLLLEETKPRDILLNEQIFVRLRLPFEIFFIKYMNIKLLRFLNVK